MEHGKPKRGANREAPGAPASPAALEAASGAQVEAGFPARRLARFEASITHVALYEA